MVVFSAFLDDCCSATKHGFVHRDTLQSAWVSYNRGHTLDLAHELAAASGYRSVGNISHPVILGITLLHWPSGSLTRRRV